MRKRKVGYNDFKYGLLDKNNFILKLVIIIFEF